MTIVTRQELAAKANVDPWALTRQFTSGSPAEIESLAVAFAKASQSQEITSTLTRHDRQLAAQGYHVDGSSPVDVGAEVAATDADMGDRGSKLGQIAKILDSTAEDLAGRTKTATAAVATLEGKLTSIEQDYNKLMQGVGHHLPPDDQETIRSEYIQKMVTQVALTGGPIKTSVSDYEQSLGQHLRSMADLGYVPPDALDEGPGDAGFSTKAGATDGKQVKDAVDGKPSTQGIEQIRAAEQKVALLNAKIKAGGKLTPEEQAYLDSFYNAVGSDGLAKLPGYVEKAASLPEYAHRGPDGYPVESPEDLRSSLVTPVADGIMNLSNPSVTADGKPHVPQAVKTLENTPIGYVDPDTGIRWAENVDVTGNRYGNGLHVDGMNTYGGFADLMGSADIKGGTDFTKSLGESAIRVKQQLNQISGSEMHWIRTGGGFHYDSSGHPITTDEMIKELKAATNDDASGEMLGVVGQNEAGSQALIGDGHDREALLGMNWGDAQAGAASVITTATQPHQTGSPTHAEAQAALQVMQTLGQNPTAYHAHVTPGVDGAVLDMAKNYMSTFAQPADPNNPTSSINNALTDPFGQNHVAVVLSDKDKEHFLEYLMSGKGNAVKFQGAADYYSQGEYARAFQSHDPTVLDKVMQQAGALDGSITKGDFHAQLNVVQHNDDARAAAYQAALHRAQGEQFVEGLVRAGVVGAVGIGTAGAGLPAVAAAGIGVGTSLGGSVVDHVFQSATDPGQAPTPQLPTAQAQLNDTNSQDYLLHRDYNMLVGAHAAGRPVDPSLLQNGQVVDMNKIGANGQTDQISALQSQADKLDPSSYRLSYDNNFNSYSNGSYYNDLANIPGAGKDPMHTGDGARSVIYGINADGGDRIVQELYPDNPGELWTLYR